MKPTAYVINLDRRPERWARTQELWSQHFNLIRWPATDMPGAGAEGCKASHLALAEKVLATEEVVIVLEDDAVPTEHFTVDYCNEVWHRRDEWDYINAGPCVDPEFTGRKDIILTPTRSRLFLKTSFSYRTHFVIYNRASLALLRASIESKEEVDVFLGHHAKSQWVPVHVLATQADGISDIRTRSRESSVGYVTSEKMLQEAVTKAVVAGYVSGVYFVVRPETSLPVIMFGEVMHDVPEFHKMRIPPPSTEPAGSNAKFLTACLLAMRQGYSHLIYTTGDIVNFDNMWNAYYAAGKLHAFANLGKAVSIFPLAAVNALLEISGGGTVEKASQMQIYHHEIAWRLFRDHAKGIVEHVITLDFDPATP